MSIAMKAIIRMTLDGTLPLQDRLKRGPSCLHVSGLLHSLGNFSLPRRFAHHMQLHGSLHCPGAAWLSLLGCCMTAESLGCLLAICALSMLQLRLRQFRLPSPRCLVEQSFMKPFSSCCESCSHWTVCNAGRHGHGKGPCSHQWGCAHSPLLQGSHYLR